MKLDGWKCPSIRLDRLDSSQGRPFVEEGRPSLPDDQTRALRQPAALASCSEQNQRSPASGSITVRV